MKLKQELVLRRIADDHMIVDPSDGVGDLSKVFTLNATAAYLWQSLESREFELETVEGLLLDQYEVEPEVAARDAKMFIKELKSQGIIVK